MKNNIRNLLYQVCVYGITIIGSLVVLLLCLFNMRYTIFMAMNEFEIPQIRHTSLLTIVGAVLFGLIVVLIVPVILKKCTE